MKITTTAGTITAVQMPENDDVVLVKGNPDAIQAIRDGLVMSGVLPEDWPKTDFSWCTVSKEDFAVWVQFEILNYLTYIEFEMES